MTIVTTPAPARRGPGRPRGGDGDRTRAAVLDVAVELFASSGFRGTSLSKVAEQAGLSQAGLLHHFPSKLHLLAEVLRRRDEIDSAQLGADERGPIGWGTFEMLVDLVELNSRRRGLVHLYATMAGEATDVDHPAHGWLQDHLQTTLDRLSDALRAGQVAGTVHPDAPVERIAALTIAVLDGLQIQWLALPAPENRAPATDMVGAVREWVDTVRARWEVAPISPGPISPTPISPTPISPSQISPSQISPSQISP